MARGRGTGRRAAAARSLLAMLFATLAGASPAFSQAPVAFTSLEWPPFSSEHLPGGGAVIDTVRRVFALTGTEILVTFLPWSRALALSRTSPYRGILPEYDGNPDCRLSGVIGHSPLVFAHLGAFDWRVHEDLRGRRIGVVQDYVNEARLDAMIARGDILAEPAVSDTINLRKLAAGRLEVIVIDGNVLRYLLRTDPLLRDASERIRPHPRVLEMKSLHVCWNVRDGTDGVAAEFDRLLREANSVEMVDAYLARGVD